MLFILFMFGASSVSMILLNKQVMTEFPHPSYVLLLQNITTILFVVAFFRDIKFEAKTAKSWLPCVSLFFVNIYSSLQALQYISVPTFTVFRNIQPLFTSVLNYFIRKESISYFSIALLMVIVYGTCVYAINDLQFHIVGYMWTLVHVVSMSLYSITIKLFFEGDQLKSYEMSFYNNLMSIPVLLVQLAIDTKLEPTIVYESIRCSETLHCIVWLVLSCVCSFFISYFGFQSQDVLSPVSWLTYNNLCKIPCIVISSFIWPHLFSDIETLGMVISLSAGYFYSMSQMNYLNVNFKRIICFLLTCAMGYSAYLICMHRMLLSFNKQAVDA